MDEEKTESLRVKRHQMRTEARLKSLRERVASQLTHLDTFGETYKIYYEFENLNWIGSNIHVRKRDGYNGIHGDFQIDIDDSTTSNTLKIREEEIDSYKFSQQVSSLISDHNRIIICSQGGDPELEMSIKAFLSFPTKFLCQPETWIMTVEKKWIIEYIWEQGAIRFIQLQGSMPTLVKKIIIEEE